MALIEAVVSSALYQIPFRMLIGGGVVAASENALCQSPKKPLERLTGVVLATLAVAQMLRTLPLEPLTIAAYTAWAPTTVTVAGVALAIFAPHLNDYLLRGVQFTAIVLTLLSACIAHSPLAWATLGTMTLFALHAHSQMPAPLSRVFTKVVFCAGKILATISLLGRAKRFASSLSIPSAVLFTALGLFIGYNQHKKRQVQAENTTPQASLEMLEATSATFAEAEYINALPGAYQETLEEWHPKLETKLARNLTEVEKAYLDSELRSKWGLICDPAIRSRIPTLSTLPDSTELPDWSNSYYAEWIFGRFTSSITILMRGFNPTFNKGKTSLLDPLYAGAGAGDEANLEAFLSLLHEKAMSKVNGTTLTQHKTWAKGHLTTFAQGVTQY